MTKKKIYIPLPRSVKKLFPQVESALDADTPIEVSVEPKDCKEGKKFNPAECALARAAKREHHADGVIIGMSSSYIIKGKQAIRFATPQSVQREIVSFDRHQDFSPGEYTLVPKSPTARFGMEKRARKSGGTNKSAKRKIHQSARVRILAKGYASKR